MELLPKKVTWSFRYLLEFHLAAIEQLRIDVDGFLPKF